MNFADTVCISWQLTPLAAISLGKDSHFFSKRNGGFDFPKAAV